MGEGKDRCFCSIAFDLRHGKWKTKFQKEKIVVQVICHIKELRSQREVMAGFSLPEDEIDLSRDCKRMA